MQVIRATVLLVSILCAAKSTLGQCPPTSCPLGCIRVRVFYHTNTEDNYYYCPGSSITLNNITNNVKHINIWSIPGNQNDIGLVTLSGTAEYYDGSAWQDITDDFEAEPGATARDVVVVAMTSLDFAEDVTYCIRPILTNPGSGRTILKCSGVTGEPPVDIYEYRLNW